MEDERAGATPRLTKSLLLVVGLVAAATAMVGGLWYLSSAARGIWRLIVAVAIGLSIGAFGIGFFRQFANPPHAENVPADVPAELGLVYVCEVCGLELKVVKVSTQNPPKHCGEEMTLIRRAI